MADDPQDKLTAIKKEYAKNLPAKIAEIQKQWDELKSSPTTEGTEAFHMKMHSLAGSAGIYGFASISQVAKQIELLVDGASLDAEKIKKIENLIPGLNNFKETQAQEIPVQAPTRTETTKTSSTPITSAPLDKTIFFLVNAEDAKKYKDEASVYGYEAEVFTSLFNFTKRLTEKAADILVLDVDFIIDFSSNELKELQEQYIKTTPVIFLSRSGEFSFRLRAVKANGKAFFIKSFNFTELVDEIERILSDKNDKLRILIIDDDTEVASYYSEILNGFNMETKIINQAKLIDTALHEFYPDLILTDFHMPECDGRELAAIIRQQRAFEAVPIIFLSGEEDRWKQLNALHTGADDFITKSINPEHLQLAITNRANRYKRLSKLITNDNLTGMLSYSTITKQVNDKFAEMSKDNKPFSLGLLKIDNFKQINDTYGYAAGDQVINMLAEIMRNKLRLRDLVGRYGVAEFLIVLPETDEATAKKLIEEIHAQFKAASFWWDYRMFSSTFAASIASFPNFPTATKLLEAVKNAIPTVQRDTITIVGQAETVSA